MCRPPRSEQFTSGEICVVHCIHRCVRRAFLCGVDNYTGKDYSYRREWIRQRLESLASVYGIDVLEYTILSNHVHVILRNRPDVVASWSDEEVAQRWLRLFPGTRLLDILAEANEEDVKRIVGDADEMKRLRSNLSDISWFMRSLAEIIARRSNFEDNCTGAFWEGRFKAHRILDDAGLLACSMYVNLNVLRANLATSIENSLHTSVYDRIEADKGVTIDSAALDQLPLSKEESIRRRTKMPPDQLRELRKRRKPTKRVLRDAWLAPLFLSDSVNSFDPQVNLEGTRASDRGFLKMGLNEYVELLRWTAAQKGIGVGQVITVPDSLQTLFKGLGIDTNMWSDLVWNYDRYFGKTSCTGSKESMQKHAKAHNKRWHRGQQQSTACFKPETDSQ